MTVIAYRDGVMAADSLVGNNEGLIVGDIAKLARREDGSLAGCAGHAGDVAGFRDWFLAGSKGSWQAIDKDHGFAAIIVSPQGQVTLVDQNGRGYRVEAPFYARGVGAELACGAMAMGARADQAVEVACRYSVYCGGNVEVERLALPRPCSSQGQALVEVLSR
jgi:hypothetical protein